IEPPRPTTSAVRRRDIYHLYFLTNRAPWHVILMPSSEWITRRIRRQNNRTRLPTSPPAPDTRHHFFPLDSTAHFLHTRITSYFTVCSAAAPAKHMFAARP